MAKTDSFISSLRADFARKALWELVKWGAFALVALAWTYFGSDWLTRSVAVLTPFRWPLTITALVAVFLGCVALYRRFNRFYPRYGRLDFEFLIVKKEIHYIRTDDGRVTYTKRCRLRALKDGLDTYRDKYHWSGSNTATPETTIKGQTVYLTVRKNVWQFYEIRLQKTLNRGDELDVEVRWNLDDSDRNAVPFFSATIEEPTRCLVMHLALPKSLGIQHVTYEVSSSIGANRPFRSTEESLSHDCEITQKIDDPQLFHHYELKWIY